MRLLLVSGVALGFAIAMPAAAEVSVHRGIADEAAEASKSAGVSVYRGYHAEKAKHQRRHHRRARVATAAGDHLWIIDHKSGEIAACDLVRTGHYRESRIDCWSGDLY